MPTPPRRWPTEAESEREGALNAANEAIQRLQKAQETLDTARSRVNSNQSLTTVLLADTDRCVADALTRMERIRRFMMVARSKPVTGRWPMVATKQREDVETLTTAAAQLLSQAQDHLERARTKLNINPGLTEAVIADVAHFQAKALTQTERITSLLIEAAIGRD